MINTPRMTCYEKFMRQSEFSQNNFYRSLNTSLNEINESYDWSNHNKKATDVEIFKDDLAELDKIVAEYIDGIDNDKIYDKPSNHKLFVNCANLPLAIVDNIIISRQLRFAMHYSFHKNFDFELIKMKKEFESTNKEEIEFKSSRKIMKNVESYINKWLRTLYHFHMFRQEMNNTVLIGRELLIELGNTDFPATTDYLKSPFRSFYLMFEPGSVISEGYEFEGSFVNLENNHNGDTVLRIELHVRVTKKNRNEFNAIEPITLYWELEILKGNDMMVGILQAIENIKEKEKLDPEKEGIMAHFSNTVVQVLLYMTSVNRDSVLVERESKPIDKNRTKKFLEREETQTNYHLLGTRTNFIGGSVNKNGNSSNKKGNGKKLMFKTTVRGHWHSFWYKDEAKIAQIPLFMHREEKYDDMGKKMIKCIKWVPPYYRGEGEEVTKEYKLTTGGQKLKKGA